MFDQTRAGRARSEEAKLLRCMSASRLEAEGEHQRRLQELILEVLLGDAALSEADASVNSSLRKQLDDLLERLDRLRMERDGATAAAAAQERKRRNGGQEEESKSSGGGGGEWASRLLQEQARHLKPP